MKEIISSSGSYEEPLQVSETVEGEVVDDGSPEKKKKQIESAVVVGKEMKSSIEMTKSMTTQSADEKEK